MSAPSAVWPQELAAAAVLLSRADGFATSLDRSTWDFAVELDELLRLGLSRADLRWLICRGLLEHRAEIVSSTAGRLFQATGPLAFAHTTCFVLTAAGREAALRLTSTALPAPSTGLSPALAEGDGSGTPRAAEPARPQVQPSQPGNGHSALRANGASHGVRSELKPVWNAELNRLTFGDLIVKEYRTPAPNQQCILAVFEEEGWPPRIDDPLPPAPEMDPKRRLHETIISLNRNQRNRVMRFGGDGNGMGIRWQFLDLKDGKSPSR
jgi:hypothetical protein